MPFNPSLRLLENDASYVTMQDVYDQRCEAIGQAKEEAMLLFADKTKRLIDSGRTVSFFFAVRQMHVLVV